jgi:hypothetical protein
LHRTILCQVDAYPPASAERRAAQYRDGSRRLPRRSRLASKPTHSPARGILPEASRSTRAQGATGRQNRPLETRSPLSIQSPEAPRPATRHPSCGELSSADGRCQGGPGATTAKEFLCVRPWRPRELSRIDGLRHRLPERARRIIAAPADSLHARTHHGGARRGRRSGAISRCSSSCLLHETS